MIYALVKNDVIETVINTKPHNGRRLDTEEWVMFGPNADDAMYAECGWLPVDETAVRPANTATTFWQAEITLILGLPVLTWTEQTKTPQKLEQDEKAANKEVLLTQARTAYQNNKTWLQDGPFNNNGVTAQVQDLTRQMNGVIRVIADLLKTTDA